ncbi:hypothetical protein Q8A67_008152 [Cirrhinus molitorella]|uniref:non-specific serine/threonine protein kinase n=1 Tax=Cirrhinus molitorella TaxID=172907 RepID=A0AA88Q3H2_9TELE|nr:hypothetical protein Q8A67_008152 [Cirrhinus molitorella]
MKLSTNNRLTPDTCCSPADLHSGLSGLEVALSIDPCPSGIELTVNIDPADPEPSSNSGLSNLGMTPDSDPSKPESSPVPCPFKLNFASELISVSEPSSVKVTPGPSLVSIELTPDMGQPDPEPSPVAGPSGFGPAVGKGNRVAPDLCGTEQMAHQDLGHLQPSCTLSNLESPSDSSKSSLELTPHIDQANQELSALPGPSSLKMTVDSKITPAPSPGFGPTVSESVLSLYDVGVKLGFGAHGIVYEGTRKSDGHKVSVKFLHRTHWEYFINLPGFYQLSEVAVNLVLGKPPTSPSIIQMLEWFDQSERCILVMEYPHPCETLLRFTERNGGYLDESMARGLMWQAVLAAKDCVERGVLHGDIKTDNVLVNTETLQLK